MMNKVTMLFFVLLMGAVQASDDNIFNNNPEEVQETNKFESNSSEDEIKSLAVVQPGVGVGGTGTGEAVPIDEYDLGLLLIAFSIIAYQAKALRPRKQKI